MFTITMNLTLAKAIIDMENHGFSEGLGPESEEGRKEWDNLIQTIMKEYGSHLVVYDPRFKSKQR